MKKNIIVMILSIVFLISIVVIGLGPKGFYYRVLYFGDRIKVKTSILVDGKEVNVDKDTIEIGGSGVGKETIKVNSNDLDVSFKGNESSLYTIDFKAGEYNFRIGITHFNWWDIDTFDVSVNVDTKDKKVKFKSSGKYIDEESMKEKDFNVEKEYQIDELNVISVGIY
jgi:hypothetical protein